MFWNKSVAVLDAELHVLRKRLRDGQRRYGQTMGFGIVKPILRTEAAANIRKIEQQIHALEGKRRRSFREEEGARRLKRSLASKASVIAQDLKRTHADIARLTAEEQRAQRTRLEAKLMQLAREKDRVHRELKKLEYFRT